jgi:glucose-1-phosphate cytidylyltransferase
MGYGKAEERRMKVVLFCGGFGLRIREYSEEIPKPMVPIGNRPILWHVMKYYAHFGHTDFILCLGHQSHAVKQYFLHYDECISNDFTMSGGGRDIKLARRDIEDWNITFVDTGMNSNIGQRLLGVREYLRGEDMFLANYSDGLTDLPLPRMIERLQAEDRVAAFLCVRPTFSCHFIEASEAGEVCAIRSGRQANLWINGGFFVLRQAIFDHLQEGEELVVEPFERLRRQKKLLAYKYEGFFQAMDTFKERQHLEHMFAQGNGHAPWMIWSKDQNGRPAVASSGD